MSKTFMLYEHASGYALFHIKEFEEVAMFLPQLQECVTDLQRFNSVVKLFAYQAFTTAVSALENINAVSEGIVTDDLALFLDTSIEKKKNVELGVSDPKLSAAIGERLKLKTTHIGVVPEVTRGIRMHFDHIIRTRTNKDVHVAQLGLGHSYSRAKVKFNVNRVDNMIIQSIALLDQLDKDVNTFAMRIREWYSYHFPELAKIVTENYKYAKVACMLRDRKAINEEEHLEKLEEILMDSAAAQAVIDAAKSSMGMDISEFDLKNIEIFAERVVKLTDYRKSLAQYLHEKMDNVAPNLQVLIGDQVGARLISSAGSLTNLAKYPASTVQILGAEKALFRALKARTNTPKYGLLYHSSFIGRAGLKNKGRISRILANKCSIASRLDCFLETPTKVFGESLRAQVEERLTFYESGQPPRKNVDVMKEASELNLSQMSASAKKNKKKKKKDKQVKNGNTEPSNENDESTISGFDGNNTTIASDAELQTSEKKKKKKRKLAELNDTIPTETSLNGSAVEGSKKKKKKKA